MWPEKFLGFKGGHLAERGGRGPQILVLEWVPDSRVAQIKKVVVLMAYFLLSDH